MRRVPAACVTLAFILRSLDVIGHTLRPGLLVRLPLSFINAPLTLSPILALRLWWWTGVAVVAWPAWCPVPVVRVVRVVVVVVVVVAGVRFACPPPRMRVLRDGLVLVWIVRGEVRVAVVRGAWRRARGILIVDMMLRLDVGDG